MKQYLQKNNRQRPYWPFHAFIHMLLFVMLLIVCAGISSAMSTDDKTLISGFCHAAYHTELIMPY
jgi:hypothetical protein